MKKWQNKFTKKDLNQCGTLFLTAQTKIKIIKEGKMLLEKLLSMDPIEAILYLEQNVNYLFQSEKRKSSVSEKYQPEKCAQYLMPYTFVNLNDKRIDCFFLDPKPNLIREIVKNDSIKFFIHPEMIKEYKENGYEDLLNFAGEELVAPTASTRTVITKDLSYNFMIKVNMTKVIGFLSRKMKLSSVKQSYQIMKEMAEIIPLLPSSLAYLPEPVGVVYREEVGEIFRECQAKPEVQDKRYLIPFFSLISLDRKAPQDPLLLCQIVEKKIDSPWKFFKKMILKPLLDSWRFLVFERGILPVVHFQNLLLELNKEGHPTRIVFRDLQDASIDRIIRKRKGLHNDFARHFVGDINHFQFYLGNEMVKTEEASRQITYSLAWDFWLGLFFSCFSVVLSKYTSFNEGKMIAAVKEYFRENIDDKNSDFFPKDQFAITKIDSLNPRIRFVESRGTPKYR